MQQNIQRKRRIYWFLAVCAGALVLSKIWVRGNSDHFATLWGTGLLLLGAMITGWLFQPMVKSLFPKANDERCQANPGLCLKDHETLMGYYPVVALLVLGGSYIISPWLYGDQILFEIKSPHFWWAALGTGVLNVFIFYFTTKALRYGDLSLISVVQTLTPVLALPISYAAFALLKERAPLSNPSVSVLGFAGIMITLVALIANTLFNKSGGARKQVHAPKDDWFAQYPLAAVAMSVLFAAVAINFDKIAIDSANPFLAGVIMPIVVALLTVFWTIAQSGLRRVSFVFRSYCREFLAIGVVYGVIILIMNVTLYGLNVNYYGTIKRSSAFFATLYGLYVLREGANMKERTTRFIVGISVVLGILLISLKG